MFISLIVSSLTTIGIAVFDQLLIMDKNISLAEVNFTKEPTLFYAKASLMVLVNGSQVIVFLLVGCIIASITLMALRNYQFTYKSDICLLISSIICLLIIVTATVVVYILLATEKYHEPTGIAILASLFSVAFLVKFVFAMLILVPLCCRACGYNLCMKTAATIKSHRKALREIVPLFILIVPFLLFICLFVTSLITRQYFVYNVLTFSITGLVCALSFALHIFFVRKKLKKLRDRSTRRPANTYGSIRQFCTNRSTEFTAEGLSESCNTEHIVVSESEIDTRFLLRGAMND